MKKFITSSIVTVPKCHYYYYIVVFFSVITFVAGISKDVHRPCIPRDFGKGSFVCVCNSTYCDFAEPLQTPSSNEQFNQEGLIQIYTSTKNGQRLHKSIQYFNSYSNFYPGTFFASMTPPPPPPRSNYVPIRQSEKQTDDDVFTVENPSSPTIYGNDLDSSASSYFFDSNRNTTRRITRRQATYATFPGSSIDLTNLPQEITRRLIELFTLGVGGTRLTRRQQQPQPQPQEYQYQYRQQGQQIPKFIISPQQIFQEVIGFGGSFTDATGINLGLLSQPTQLQLMKSYFGKNGNDYSMGRVPIGGTDFSTRPYTLNDVKFLDMNLTHFSLQPEDHQLKMPYIKLAQSLSDRKLRLIASPWSAPKWMKTSGRLTGLGFLDRRFYQVWADYFVRFIDEYRAHNIPIWGVTTGNEPLNGFIPQFPFNCMGWSPSSVKQWITNNLGPSLSKMNRRYRRESKESSRSSLTEVESEYEDVKLIILDDNKISLPFWSQTILEDKSSASYVDGVGTHWYLDFLASSDVLSQFHQKHPNYFIIQTEACLGFLPWELEKVIPGSWERGEKYLEAIINDMRNWVGGWIDWNLALSLSGGPNWASWAADAAILVNPKTDEFFKQPIYYAIGQISRFVPPGSRRIEITGTHVPRNLQSVAFLRPDNGTVLIFLNKHSDDIKISIYDDRRGSTFLTIPARAMQTVIYW